jgi:deoxycytidylate deaminase
MKLKFFDIARKFVSLGEHHQHKVSAVLVQGNRVVSWGYNRNKTHSNSPHPFKSIHAEYDAIRRANPSDVVGSTIYVYRELRDETPAMSRPCPSCMELLKSVGIERVCYTENGTYKEEII